MIIRIPISRSLNTNSKNIFKSIVIILIFSKILFLIPTATANDITFSELGLATDFTSGKSGNTSTGIFYSESNDYPLELYVHTYFSGFYKPIIYLNDIRIDYPGGSINGNKGFSVTFEKDDIKKGKNTICIQVIIMPRGLFPVKEFDGFLHTLTIYGDSKISSPDIFLPSPAPTQSQSLISILRSPGPPEMIFIIIPLVTILVIIIGFMYPKKEQTYVPKIPSGNIPDQTYQDYINSDDWKIRSYDCRTKANGYCFLCNNNVGIRNLVCHHIKYPKDYRHDKEDKNYIAICHTCHEKLHGLKKD